MPLKPHRKLLLGLKLLNFLKMSDNHSMENPKNISGNASASRLSIANLSVALSFILATLFSTGAILQSAVGLRSRIPVLPSFQIQLIEIITAYWLPTIVVYALIRITGFDSRLIANGRSHALILFGNAIYCAYLVKQGTSTTAYEYFAKEILFIVPTFIVYAIAIFTLKSNGVWTRQREREPVSVVEVMAVVFLAITPVAYLSSAIHIKDVYKIPTLSSLCNQATIKRVITVERPSGIFIPYNYFSHYSTNTGGKAFSLLNQRLFEFVEVGRLSDNYNGHFSTAKFERIRLDSDNKDTKFIYEPIEVPSAEYEIRVTDLALPDWLQLKLHGYRIDIRRVKDQALIGYAQYYWSSREKTACPSEIADGNFVEDFIAGTLGAKSQISWIK
jgi:hypothetical protein